MILWKYPTDAFYLGEHTPARGTFRGVERIEQAAVDLQRFTVTGRPLPTRWRKDESATERIALRIEGWDGTDTEREVERTQSTVDGFEGSGVLMLWTESVRIDANGVRGHYL